METPGAVADAVKGNWVDRHAPAWFRPYARLSRLDRPIGWWLLLFPCWWSAAMAAGATGQSLWALVHPVLAFLIGAIAMRGAGCTYNDIVDRRIDAEVARTRSRPIPSGQVSLIEAVVWLAAQAVVGLLVLITFNATTILVGIASLVLVAIYPFMKRVTYWPQLFLGFAFSWGALVGWTAVAGGLGWPAVILYAAGILWTIGYDTIYALQDVEDDALIGVKSTARLFGERAPVFVALFFAGATVLFAAAFYLAGAHPVAYGALAIGAAHLAWQVAMIRIDDPQRCLMLFKSNRWYGWILFVGLLLWVWLGSFSRL
jgi:4-hydroxybenzoate polyprenyltransferase